MTTKPFVVGILLPHKLNHGLIASFDLHLGIHAFVMTKDPDWRSLPAGVPRSIRDLLRRCLIKDPRARLQSIGDARVLIEEAIAKPEHAETETSKGCNGRGVLSCPGLWPARWR